MKNTFDCNSMRRIRPGWFFIVPMFITLLQGHAQNAGDLVTATNGMVVSASAEATEVGLHVLEQGGNAVDAAVAVGFALAVTYPGAGNLGGGAYIVIRMADGRTAAIDAREVAPAAATRDMYLDENNQIIEDASLVGPLAAGVPGTVDGLLRAHAQFGSTHRQDVLAPALRLARDGFPLHPRAANLFRIYQEAFSEFPSSLEIFRKPDASLYAAGDLWRQPELAATLERISHEGRDGFYQGETADLIVQQMDAGGGIITHDDLAGYASIVRTPVQGTYDGYTILSMPPSSSGGIVLLEMLHMLAEFPLQQYDVGSFEYIHVMTEVMKRAFADRSVYLGDPEFTTIPIDALLSPEYAKKQASGISLKNATPGSAIKPGAVPLKDGMNTTHYSILDRWGNAVSVTTTLNSTFGSKCVVAGAGFLLNNEMDDFSSKPGVPNQFGLTGSDANSIEPGKRMLSSMTPIIVTKNGTPVLVTGSPGGSTIITTVLQVFMNVYVFHMPLDEAIAAPRFHHQWKPDEITYEDGAIGAEAAQKLKRAGHTLRTISSFGRAEGVLVDEHGIHGCSDPRGYGAALGY